MSKDNKGFRLEDVPMDVQKVWVIQHYCETYKTGVGSELYNECQRIINAYPEWFPTPKNQTNEQYTK
ncbi:MAG TPA: hypothetical protein PKV73_16640 [Agriterribacter sp.]|nr:hypothetical protein [Agriterribacter sp.]